MMGGLISTLFGQVADKSADQTLAYSLMSEAAAASGAYLAATLASTTPELRSILGGFVSQKVMEHESLTKYMMDQGWMDPYENPVKRLEETYRQASSLLSQH